MLHELSIRNFAIIDDLHIQFANGLNILTGETGAGKSIIIDALGLLLGDRGAVEWVRAGTEMAAIEASFYLSESAVTADVVAEVHRYLEEQGLDDPDTPDWLTLSREVRLNGRNVCRVNGRAVSLQILSDVAGLLIDIHGQGEHLNLLRPKTHIHLLDRYGGLSDLRRQVSAQAAKLRGVRAELQRLRQDARTIAQRVDLLSFQTEEIDQARLRPDEDVELEGERRRLGNAEALMQLAQSAATILSQGESEMPGAIDLVSEAAGRVERLARIDPDLQQSADEVQGVLEQLSDLARSLQDYADRLEFNPERLQEVEERLELIHNLKRKYGDSIQQILDFGERAQTELDGLANWEVRTAELEEQEEKYLHAIGRLAADLSAKRQQAGTRMARQVEAELADLRMARARFGVSIEQSERPDGAYLPDGRRVAFDSSGVDRVEFLISANPGEPLKPMVKVASGGETARLMLALKSVLANADATPTLIFDEIDQGIGGRVGSVVGQKLWNLTGRHAGAIPHQVLCITHLPQLAAYGDAHFTVNKRVIAVNGEERTATVVRNLQDDARIDELTNMLGATGDAGRRSVEEMVAEVAKVKAGHTNGG
jgi:DNA repair protein RecN (Recombination protein N)